MPQARKKTPRPTKTTSKKTNQDVQIALPKSFRIKSFTPILVILLIVASFLIGMMFGKLQALQAGQSTTSQAGQQAAAGQNPGTTTQPVYANVSNGHIPPLGSSNAKVKIIEFADLRCPYCDAWFKDVLPQIKKNYIDTGKVELYFRHFAFLGSASTLAANGAECANEQGKFWDYYDYMYTNQPDESDTSMYTVDNLTSVASQLGMDSSQFNTCLSGNKYNNNVTADYNDGTKAGVSGTPTFYVNGYQIVGAEPYSVFQKAIDDALAKAK